MTRGRYIDQQKYCRNLQAFDQILDTINAYTPGSFYCPEHEVVCHKGEHDISKTGYLCQFCTKTFYQTRQRRKSSTIKKIDDEQCQQDFEEFIKHFNLHKERLQKQQQLQQEQSSSHDCQMSTSSSSSVSSISITSMNSTCSTNTLESSIEDLTTEFKTKASINNGLEMSDRRCSSTPNLLKLLRHDSIKSNNNSRDNYNDDDDNNNEDDDDEEDIEPIEIFTQGYLMDENYKSESLSVAEVGFIQQQRAKYFQKYLKLSNRFGTLNKDTTTATRKSAKVDPRLRKRKYINASYFGDSVYLSEYSDSYDSSDDDEEEEEEVEEQEEELYENVSDDDITPTRVLVDNQQEQEKEEDEESDYSIDSDDDDYYEDSEDEDYYYEENEEGQLQQEQQNLAQRHPSIVEFNICSAPRRNNNSSNESSSSSSSSSSCTPLEPLSYSLTNVYEREISDGEEEDHDDDDDDVFGNNNNVDYFTMMLAQAQHPITVATAARALNNNNNSTYHNHHHRRHSVSSISAIVGNNKSNNNQQKHHQHNSITPVSSICTDSTTGTANVDMINNSQNVDIMTIEKKSKLLQFINKPQVESSSSSLLSNNNNNNNNKKKFISHKPRFSLPFITPFSTSSSSSLSNQQQQKHQQEKSTVFPLSNDCILNLHKSSTSSSSSSSTIVSPTLTVSSSSIKTTRESIMSKNIISRQYDKLQRKIKQSFL